MAKNFALRPQFFITLHLLADVILQAVFCQSVIYDGEWSPGRSTYYTTFDFGNCGYEKISDSSFPYRHIAAPNHDFYKDGAVCGQCYEVKCIDGWHKDTPGCCNSNTPTVTVQITDQCPISLNEEYCSGDEVHFDLSFEAFKTLANPLCGVIETQYRRVSCDFEQNIQIRNQHGTNEWWYAIHIKRVAGYGDLTRVEMRDSSGDGFWRQGTTLEDTATWVFEQKLERGFIVPFDLRLTNGNGQVLTAWQQITSTEPGATFDFGSNFAHEKEEEDVDTILEVLGRKSSQVDLPLPPVPLAIVLTTSLLLVAWLRLLRIRINLCQLNCLRCLGCESLKRYICRACRILDASQHRRMGLEHAHSDGHTPPPQRSTRTHVHVLGQGVGKKKHKYWKDRNPAFLDPIIIKHDADNIPTLRHLTPTRDK